jgi:WD40 repeat protein
MPPRTTFALGRGGSNVTSASFSPDGKFLLTDGADGMARVWTASGKQVAAVRDPSGRAVALTSTGELALTTNDDSTARLLRVKDGKQIAAIKLGSSFPVVALTPDGQRLVSTAREGARLWDSATGKVLARFDVNLVAIAVAVSPDGETVAIAYGDGTTRLREGMNGRLLSVLPAHGTSVDSIAFNPDGTRLATAAGNTVRIWDVRRATQVSVFRADVRGVVITSFSPDGRFILAAGFLGTTTVWDAETGERLGSFRGADGPATVWAVKAGHIFDARKADGLLTGAWFANDGEHVLTATIRGAVREYTCELCVSTDGLVALARERATRRLTAAERQSYLRGG